MKMSTDDEIRDVDNVFLGPKGYTFPFAARYGAYAVGGTLGVIALIVVRRAHYPIGPWLVILTTAAVVGLTKLIMAGVSYEVPLRQRLAILWHELEAPRPNRSRTEQTLTPGRVRITVACGDTRRMLWRRYPCTHRPHSRGDDMRGHMAALATQHEQET